MRIIVITFSVGQVNLNRKDLDRVIKVDAIHREMEIADSPSPLRFPSFDLIIPLHDDRTSPLVTGNLTEKMANAHHDR